MSRFRRRLMGLAALRQAAADDFVRVEYIENTSTAYINSGIFGTMNLDFYIEFEPTQLHPNSGKGFGSIFGSRAEWNQNVYQLTTFNKNATNKGHFIAAKNYGFSDNRVPTANMFLGGKNIIKKEGLIFTRADGTTFNLTSQSFTTPTRISIFGLTNVNGGVGENCKFKLYKLQFSKNGALVRDFIPMYQISTDTYGLWDRVTEEFYVSPNGVKFNGGERVVADANENLYYLKNYIYINSTQTQYIILKPFTDTDNVELKVHPISATNYWFGDRSASGNQRRLQIASWNNTRLDIARSQFPSISYPNGIINKDITLKLDGKQFYVNNELLYTFTSTLSTTNNTNLGRVYNTGRHTDSRFYWFKWWNKNKDLIYDLIPVQRCSDGVWGFFDKVSLAFHSSDGTAQFTGG